MQNQLKNVLHMSHDKEIKKPSAAEIKAATEVKGKIIASNQIVKK